MEPEDENAQAPQSNLEKLSRKLKDGSLARKLVSARIEAEGSDTRAALRKVVTDRIEELKREYDLPDNKA